MFSYKKGEPISASQHKTHLRREARREWPVLSPADLSTVRTGNQLAELVAEKTGYTHEEAAAAVRRWMERQRMRPDIGDGWLARRPISRWESEGGALGKLVDNLDV